jgi:leucyl aminopeptidase
MQVQVRPRDPRELECDGLIVPIAQTERLPRALRALDASLEGRIAAYLENGDFRGHAGQLTCFPGGGIRAARVVLVGLGPDARLNAEGLRTAAGRAVGPLIGAKAKRAALLVPGVRRAAPADVGQALTEGAVLGAYRFDKYQTLEEPPPALERLDLLPVDGRQTAGLRRGAQLGSVIAAATNLARDLSNEPGSVHTPAWMARRARALGRESGLKVSVLAEAQLAREKMGGILAVGRGSANPPRLIVFEHGAAPAARARRGRKRPTIALVGKGITFDTGGISLKPAASMVEMKHDMSGGAAVFGAMRAIAELKLPLHVVGVVACAENKPDGNAYLPGDIVTTSSGKTIEVINTDAEGRVVLSDALHYATRYEPDAIVDLATLTGACVVALGSACCGLMGNDERLISKVRSAGDRSFERAWPLPLWDEHRRQIKGTVGDLKNTGGREAGALTAAAFLSHFVGEIPWAHLDIAGTAWTTSGQPYCARGATGFGVRLLLELLRGWK